MPDYHSSGSTCPGRAGTSPSATRGCRRPCTPPRALGPNTLRYINYFLGLLRRTGLDTAAKMELLGLVNGFALSYGGVQATLAEERARTGVTAEQQASAPVHALAAAVPTPATRMPE